MGLWPLAPEWLRSQKHFNLLQRDSLGKSILANAESLSSRWRLIHADSDSVEARCDCVGLAERDDIVRLFCGLADERTESFH